MNKYIHIQIALVAFVTMFAGNCFSQNYGFKLEPNRNQSSIPFESLNNLIIIEVNINGDFPAKFILDTGVENSILFNKEICDTLNISINRHIQVPALGIEDSVNVGIVNNINLYING